MLTNFAKFSIIAIWSGLECASECSSVKSYKKFAAEVLKNRNVQSVYTTGNI